MASERAGKKAEQADLCNIPKLVTDYFQLVPDAQNSLHKVEFGTSGHRGSSSHYSFNQTHILAITQAIVDVRNKRGITGPLVLGKDTHALSEPAYCSVIEVLVANNIEIFVNANHAVTPTPSVSHTILAFNKHGKVFADGIVITPSHNPPQDGGIKYNPPHGGPAEGPITKEIESLANQYIERNLEGVKRVCFDQAIHTSLVQEQDWIAAYVSDLKHVVNMTAIKDAKLKIGVDPLGGAGIDFWKAIAAHYSLDISVINDHVDPSFRFMSLDKDGVIRMDCSSPPAMACLIAYKNDYDLAFGNDPDVDRHGIVTAFGLMNPNHFLAVCIDYLFQNRPAWNKSVGVGKTLVSSAIIDKIVENLDRNLSEVPVGFKWFVDGLSSGEIGFGGEESAGASFLRFDGTTWTTDKDGIVLCLLAAEIYAVTGLNPQEYFNQLAEKFGESFYDRIQAKANVKQKALLSTLMPDSVHVNMLAGDAVRVKMSHAPGNNESIGGLKIVTDFGWFAARPSGTEDIYKIYCESFKSEEHLTQIKVEAEQIVGQLFEQAGL